MTIRWGIIGCGDVTEVKSGPGFQKAVGSALVMVMRRNAAAAEDFARRHGVPRWTADADELIHDPEVDAVYIATPPGNHIDYALRVAAAGKPAYVEKPMARNHAECLQMIEAFTKAGQPLFVAFYRRRLPRFLKAKELLDSGRLGQVVMVEYRFVARPQAIDATNLPWRVVAEHAGGGLFLDVGCHALDILDFFFGPVTHAEGLTSNHSASYDVEDTILMSCRFATGLRGTCTWNFVATVDQDCIEITGTVGKLTLPVFGNVPMRLETSAGVEQFDLPNPLHIQQPMIQSIVDELHGCGECPVTGVTAARTAWVMDQVLEGYYGGRDDAFWTRPETWPGRREK